MNKKYKKVHFTKCDNDEINIEINTYNLDENKDLWYDNEINKYNLDEYEDVNDSYEYYETEPYYYNNRKKKNDIYKFNISRRYNYNIHKFSKKKYNPIYYYYNIEINKENEKNLCFWIYFDKLKEYIKHIC